MAETLCPLGGIGLGCVPTEESITDSQAGPAAAHRVKIRISRMVSAADITSEPRQPKRFEKNKNI